MGLFGEALAGGVNGVVKNPLVSGDEHTKAMENVLESNKSKTDNNVQTGNQVMQTGKFMKKTEFDKIYSELKQQGYTAQEVIDGLENKGYELEGWREQQENSMKKKNKEEGKKAGLFKNIIGGIGSSVTSLGSSATKLVTKGLESEGSLRALLPFAPNIESSNKLSFSDMLEGVGKQTGLSDKLNNRSQEKFGVPFSSGKDQTKFDIGQDEDSKAFKASKFIADAIQTAADTQLITSAIKKTPKGVELASGMSNKIKNVFSKMGLGEGAIEKATKITTQVLKNAGEGALDVSIFNTIAEKELPNLKTIAEGGVFGAAFPLLAAPLKKAGSGIYKMFIPKTDAEINMLLKSKAGLGSKPFTAGDTALKNKMFGTKSLLGSKALKKQNKLWNETIFPALSSSKDRITKEELLKGPMEFLDSIVIPSEKKKYNKVLKQMISDLPDDMSLVEAQNLKKSIDDVTSNKILAGERGGIEKTFNNKVANQIRSSIREKLGPKVGDAYRDFSNLYTVVKLGKNSLKTGAGAGAIESAITKGSSLGIIGHLLGQVATPAGTAVGLITNELGNMIGSDGVRRVANMLSSKLNK